MHRSRQVWLLGAVSLAGLAVALSRDAVACGQSGRQRVCAPPRPRTSPISASQPAPTCCSQSRLHGTPEGVAYALRGLAYLDRGDIPHAIADLNQAVTLAPDFAPAYQNRGNAWYARGNFGQAIADYDATIKLDPDSASPYFNRATVRRDLGYNEGALADYQKAIGLGGNSSARL